MLVRHTKKKGNASTLKEKKVSSKQKQNYALSQIKENSTKIEEEVEAGVELQAFLIF